MLKPEEGPKRKSRGRGRGRKRREDGDERRRAADARRPSDPRSAGVQQ